MKVISIRPTLKDVAERSGVSLRTVKKVMNGDTTVREKTVSAVLKAAEELNYTRNRAASALAKNQSFRIAVVYSKISEAYFPEVKKGFLEAQAEFGDYGLELEFFIAEDRGWEAQRNILEQLRDRDDLNGIIIQPFSSSHLNSLIDDLVDAGKPVLTFGADAPDSKRLCFVGPNPYRSGRIGGQILANYIGKKGEVFVFNQGTDHMQTKERHRGFLDKITESYPDISPFEISLPENNPTLYSDMVLSLVANGNVSGIFCTGANTVLAGKALRQLCAKDISLVGFNLSADGIELMNEGYIKVLIETRPEMVSFLSTKIIFKYLTEGLLPERINYTPVYVLTSECIEADDKRE